MARVQIGRVVISVLFAVLVVGTGCTERKRLNAPGPDEVTWQLGPETTYLIDTTHSHELADSVTGELFLFPEGAHGALRVARIVSGPPAPLPGEGFTVRFDGEVPLRFGITPLGTDVVMIMGYGTAPGAYDDVPGPSARWIAVPYLVAEDGWIFQLNLPFESARPGARSSTVSGGFSHYWVSSIPAGSSDETRRMHVTLQSRSYVDEVLALLSPARRAAAEDAMYRGSMQVDYSWDGLFYTGFWWRSLGSLGRMVHPTIHLSLNANEGNIAHETGHYMTHVLVGDDAWSTLEGQAPLWDTGHGIRDEIGRDVLLEEYAFFTEWLAIGTVKLYDLHDPHVIFTGLSPLTVDFPSLEGFGAVLLASLTRTTPVMRDLINGDPTDVPVLGFTEAQVYDIIAQGAVEMDALRQRVATAAGSEADKLPAIFQRSGWRHSVKGRLVDPNGSPVAGATVSSISVVGERVYRGGTSSIPTDAQGRFQIVGEVFPGESRIRVWNGTDSVDVAISIAWTSHTDQTVDLGDLEVVPSVDLDPLRYCTVDLFTRIAYESTSAPWEGYRRVQIEAVAGAFTGNLFTGSRDTTDADGIHITVDLTADVDPATGEVRTLDLTQTRGKPDEWLETIELSFAHVPKTSYSINGPRILMECWVGGEATCGSITRYHYTEVAEDFLLQQTGYSCTPDHASGYLSSLDVYFHNLPDF